MTTSGEDVAITGKELVAYMEQWTIPEFPDEVAERVDRWFVDINTAGHGKAYNIVKRDRRVLEVRMSETSVDDETDLLVAITQIFDSFSFMHTQDKIRVARYVTDKLEAQLQKETS